MAIVSFGLDAIVIFDVGVTASAGRTGLDLRSVVVGTSPILRYAHGLDFIDEDTIVVANRGGDVAAFRIPSTAKPGQSCELEFIRMLQPNNPSVFTAPGSVWVGRDDGTRHDVLICNAYCHTMTRQVIDTADACSVKSEESVAEKWLNTPDGVDVSGDRRWIAISNHSAHNILLYKGLPSLTEGDAPAGLLRPVYYPHGLRFSADGRYILVADAGAPYVHIFFSEDGDWDGVHDPAASVRTMDESVFQRGHVNPQNGGPKGIDIDAGMNVMVTTCGDQPIAVFDFPALARQASAEVHRNPSKAQRALQLRCELDLLKLANEQRDRAVLAEEKAAGADVALAAAVAAAEGKAAARIAHEEERAARFKARAAKATAKAPGPRLRPPGPRRVPGS
ncbi:MAG: hypothetical protein HC861_03220 [Rhodospirillaceae bacterium]|nr:hypothetical protein [Rhodospirillaceae bacterium]